eukprot:12421825-Karenia_brevis.AAC.1
MTWFEQFQWSELLEIQGDIFVQGPPRLEEAFCDAVGVALREITHGQHVQHSVAAWEAFLLSSWLLLYRPPDIDDGQS